MQNMTVYPQQQRGAALVVGLILLLVLTVLGVSTMSTASLELAMAGNDQWAENAFQLAETGADTMANNLNSGNFIPPNVTVPNICFPPGALTAIPGMGGTFQSTLCFLDSDVSLNACPGSSVGTSGFFYMHSTQGVAQSQQASSMHRQGMRFCGAVVN